MTGTDPSIPREATVAPQFLHRETEVRLEKALKHHRQAALLPNAGDARQAETDGIIALTIRRRHWKSVAGH